MILTKPGLTFDPEQHRYTLDGGQEIPGVTQVLKDMGLYKPPSQAQQYHKARGGAIHDGTAAVDAHEWDKSKTSPIIIPYIEAYERFTLDLGFHATHVERAVYSQRYMVAGTLDRIGRITNPASRDYGKIILVDIKSGDPAASVEIQMALYRFMALECLGVKVDACWALWLKLTGQYKIERSTDPSALQLGLSAVSLWHWRRNHGLLG